MLHSLYASPVNSFPVWTYFAICAIHDSPHPPFEFMLLSTQKLFWLLCEHHLNVFIWFHHWKLITTLIQDSAVSIKCKKLIAKLSPWTIFIFQRYEESDSSQTHRGVTLSQGSLSCLKIPQLLEADSGTEKTLPLLWQMDNRSKWLWNFRKAEKYTQVVCIICYIAIHILDEWRGPGLYFLRML